MKLFPDKSRQADIQREMRKELEPFQRWIDDNQCDEELKQLLCKYIDTQTGQIPRQIKQFDSSILLVIAMGMLKAGKSTLVNLLSHNRNTSPTGYGKDTTLRPVLIRMARQDESLDVGPLKANGKGRIDVYPPIPQEPERGLRKLMDYIRELETTPPTPPSTFELTDNNLTRLLCQRPDLRIMSDEPMLVVVNLPYNEECHMLKENRMLLDMPGLDSALADVTSPGKYEAIIKECDLMLFVQSSVAPLNEMASNMLHEILKQRSNTSCYIVQNTMRASYWRKDEVLNAAENEQAEDARKMISSLMPQGERSGGVVDKMQLPIKMSIANLGMASDGMFEEGYLDSTRKLTNGEPISKETLMEGSAFEALENNLLNEVGGSGKASRFTHCCDELWNVVDKAIDEVKKQMEKLDADRIKAGKNSNTWDKKRKKASELMQEHAKFQKLGDFTVNKKDTLFHKSRNLARDAFPEMKESRVAVSKVNKYFKVLEKNCYLEMAEFLSQELSIKDIRITAEDESAVKICQRQIDKAFSALRTNDELYDKKVDPELYWGLGENTLLHINEDPRRIGGDKVLKIDRIAELNPDGNEKSKGVTATYDKDGKFLNAVSFEVKGVFRKTMKSDSNVINLKEEEFFKLFKELIDAIVKERLEELCDKIIEDSIKAGSSAYLNALQQREVREKKECGKCAADLHRRQQLQEALQNIQKKTELLRSLPF